MTPALTDRVVMVAGATGNLGAAVARGFQAGAHWCWLIAPPIACWPVPRSGAAPQHMLCGAVDATDPDLVQQWVDAAIARFGRIDVLANTIGGYKAGTPTHETALETWDFMFNLNARTAFIISRAVLPQMLRRAPVASFTRPRVRPWPARPTTAPTTPPKAWWCASWRAWPPNTSSLGITVNCVLPGTIDTPQNPPTCPTPTGASGCRPPPSPTPLSSWPRTRPATSRARRIPGLRSELDHNGKYQTAEPGCQRMRDMAENRLFGSPFPGMDPYLENPATGLIFMTGCNKIVSSSMRFCLRPTTHPVEKAGVGCRLGGWN